MQHGTDNPGWHALIGPQAGLAIGHGLARLYPRDMAPFSAIADASPAVYVDLAADLPAGSEARLFRPTDEPAPAGWKRSAPGRSFRCWPTILWHLMDPRMLTRSCWAQATAPP